MKAIRVLTGVGIAVFAILGSGNVQGQVLVGSHSEVIDVSPELACPACSIQLTHVTRLGNPGGEGEFFSQPLSVSGLPKGGFLVSESQGGRLLSFHETGEFREAVGRPGAGPGEIGAPGPIAGIGGDSLVVVDYANGRLAVLDGNSLTIGRTVRINVGLAQGIASFRGHRVILTGPSFDPERIGLPLHTMDLSEKSPPIASFGSVDGLAVDRYQQERSISSRGGTVWSLRRAEYLVEEWDWVTGQRKRALRVRHRWFDGAFNGWMGVPESPPEPRTNGLWVDRDGRIWTFVLRAAPSWKEAWAHVGSLAGRTELFGAERPHYEKMFETQIEILDQYAGEILTRLTVGSMVGGVLDGGRFWTLTRDDLDRFLVDIWEVNLHNLENHYEQNYQIHHVLDRMPSSSPGALFGADLRLVR